MSWREIAAPIIAKVLADTDGRPQGERLKALRNAYPFGERKYHPYKIWLDEIARQTGRKPPLSAGGFQKQEHIPDPRQMSLL
jgi:hypothetical protein